MVLRLAWVVLLVGCAGMQGVPVAPPAPAFNPSWDAPITTGQPGYVGPVESLQRSPHERSLPPTKDPGLWSGDQPRASILPTIDVLGIGVPVPDAFASKSNPAIHCAVLVASGIRTGNRLQEAFDALSLTDKSCFVTSAMWTCMEWRSMLHARREAKQDNDLVLLARYRKDIDAVLSVLRRHSALVCTEPKSRPVDDLLDKWTPVGLVGGTAQ